MKKLLKELETKFKSDAVQWCSSGYQDGFDHALQIVKAHNPWYDVTELPPRVIDDGVQMEFTIEVLALTDRGAIERAYYHHYTKEWYYYHYTKEWVTSETVTPINVIKWTYLPEQPK